MRRDVAGIGALGWEGKEALRAPCNPCPVPGGDALLREAEVMCRALLALKTASRLLAFFPNLCIPTQCQELNFAAGIKCHVGKCGMWMIANHILGRSGALQNITVYDKI